MRVLSIQKAKMKKVWLFILSLFTIILVWNFTQANENYEFTNLDITADILVDGTINIGENYTANFFVERHGINRDIPLNYSVGWKDFHIEISDINVEWKKFTTSKSDWEWNIKIWDPNMTISWKQNYPISYSTYWLIRNFSWKGYAELYWDLIWSQWNTNINNFSAKILLPKPYTWFTSDDFLISIGSTRKSIKDFGWTIDRTSWDKIIITYNKRLPEYTKFTLSIKFPDNYFEFDHKRQADLIGVIDTNTYDDISQKTIDIACISYILCLILLLLIKTPKETPQTQWELKWELAEKYPTIIQYNPPKWLNSAEVWLLLHRWATYTDILSLIYKRANEWLIRFETSKYGALILKKIKDIPESYPEYEDEAFYRIFDDYKDTKQIYEGLNLHLDGSIEILNEHWETQWWLYLKQHSLFKEIFINPILFLIFIASKPFIYIFLYILMIFFMLFFFGTYGNIIMIFIFIVFILNYFVWNRISHVLWILYRKFKIKDSLNETEEWAKLISHILWYREFLKSCDEKKLRLFLENDPLYFDKILPYAIVFGLGTELIDKVKPIMEDMNIETTRYDWDLFLLSDTVSTISSITPHSSSADSSRSSYDSDSWFDSWSSFDSGSSSDSWGGWWGWSDW